MVITIEDDPRDIVRLLSNMNSNMPVNRRTLVDYIDNGGNTFTTRSGAECTFDRSAIEYLDSFCTTQEKLTLRLPIFVYTDVSAETSCWKIEGKTEVAVVSRILGRSVHSVDHLPVYYPDLKTLKNKLSDLVFTIFTP